MDSFLFLKLLFRYESDDENLKNETIIFLNDCCLKKMVKKTVAFKSNHF